MVAWLALQLSFGRSGVYISSWRPIIVTWAFHYFPQSPQTYIIARKYIKLGTHHTSETSLQFIIRLLSYHSML
jgi:hypothetical protein